VYLYVYMYVCLADVVIRLMMLMHRNSSALCDCAGILITSRLSYLHLIPTVTIQTQAQWPTFVVAQAGLDRPPQRMLLPPSPWTLQQRCAPMEYHLQLTSLLHLHFSSPPASSSSLYPSLPWQHLYTSLQSCLRAHRPGL